MAAIFSARQGFRGRAFGQPQTGANNLDIPQRPSSELDLGFHGLRVWEYSRRSDESADRILKSFDRILDQLYAPFAPQQISHCNRRR